MSKGLRTAIALGAMLLSAGRGVGQPNTNLEKFSSIPAVSGHEEELTHALLQSLSDLDTQTDDAGNMYVTIGSGAPRRLIVTPIDEPGYVVSEITGEGYLRVQRLPQASPSAVFDPLNFAQPVWVITRDGRHVGGVFAGLSVHLQSGRLNPPKMDHVEELYVDIGAKSAEEVRVAGVKLLDAVVALRKPNRIGYTEVTGLVVGDRFGAEALVRVANKLEPKSIQGSVTFAFVTQQWTGGRGLNRLLTESNPDEMIYVGRITAEGKTSGSGTMLPGAGVLVGVNQENVSAKKFSEELTQLGKEHNIKMELMDVNLPRLAGYAKGGSFPKRFAQIGVPVRWEATPIEVLDENDLESLIGLLFQYLGGRERQPGQGYGYSEDGFGSISTLIPLSLAYGASGHEEAVREEVKKLLPEWARKKTTTDTAGNLILRLADAKSNNKPLQMVFVAHMDEIGYEVKKVEDDGRLQVEVLGGVYTQYFLGHPVLVHTKEKGPQTGILELPSGWDKPGFEWPSGPKSMDEPARVYVGTHSKSDTEKFGITVGDFVTIPKEYRPLLGTRANARSFDDRVGCAALIEAVKALGPDLPGRDVTFVWSTEEEVGLKGAAAFAEQAAKEGRVPDFVFAIDTFVSSDSPLESKRFADAELGKGFVVRAVDNSNIVPLQYVDRVVALAKENNIPVQYGVTGGGNDGAVFTRFGSVDVALGWPLRYSHSPAEVIDTNDLDALGKIVEVIARKW